MISQNQRAGVGAVLAYLKTGLPNLVWDTEQGTLILDTYRADVTTSMEYDLRQLLRVGEGKYANGFSSALALPQIESPRQEHGQGHGYGYGEEAGANAGQHFKSHPNLISSSQFSGNHKDPQVKHGAVKPGSGAGAAKCPDFRRQPAIEPQGPHPKTAQLISPCQFLIPLFTVRLPSGNST